MISTRAHSPPNLGTGKARQRLLVSQQVDLQAPGNPISLAHKNARGVAVRGSRAGGGGIVVVIASTVLLLTLSVVLCRYRRRRQRDKLGRGWPPGPLAPWPPDDHSAATRHIMADDYIYHSYSTVRKVPVTKV
ncbi:uncharacterized protein [Palaemon carinicauda]|uniref:uncharacterized protein n=1 Tax=Palaemon carinicauda TaxID=392227 RepID=UPI0035B5F0F2